MNRKRVMYFIIFLLLGIILVSAGRGLALYLSVDSHAKFWRELAEKPAPKNAIILLALGDSTMQGLGAHNPLKGPVGRAAEFLEQETGRPVKIINKSKTGGTMRDVVRDQLSSLNSVDPDIVLVSVGANDAKRQRDIKKFETEAQELFAALPPERTAMTGVADVDNREPYQNALEQAADGSGIPLAPLYQTWQKHYKYRPWNYAGDYFHPSTYGYQAWQDAWEPRLKYIARSNLK